MLRHRGAAEVESKDHFSLLLALFGSAFCGGLCVVEHNLEHNETEEKNEVEGRSLVSGLF